MNYLEDSHPDAVPGAELTVIAARLADGEQDADGAARVWRYIGAALAGGYDLPPAVRRYLATVAGGLVDLWAKPVTKTDEVNREQSRILGRARSKGRTERTTDNPQAWAVRVAFTTLTEAGCWPDQVHGGLAGGLGKPDPEARSEIMRKMSISASTVARCLSAVGTEVMGEGELRLVNATTAWGMWCDWARDQRQQAGN